MTEEYRKLLITDLASRFPYGVIVNVHGFQYLVIGIDKHGISTDKGINFPITACKPYLRPMSSMTNEEFEYFDSIGEDESNYIASYKKADWLNKKGFDYRTIKGEDGEEKSMIELGLALEAPEGMYNQ